MSLNNKSLENVTCEKLLGVHLDQHLTWSAHIQSVAMTVSRNLALLRQIKCFLPLQARKMFYFSNIQPHFNYCSTIWGLGSDIKKLISLQRCAIRLILDIPHGVSLHSANKRLNIMPLTDRIDFRMCCNVHRALHKQMGM